MSPRRRRPLRIIATDSLAVVGWAMTMLALVGVGIFREHDALDAGLFAVVAVAGGVLTLVGLLLIGNAEAQHRVDRALTVHRPGSAVRVRSSSPRPRA